LVGKFNGDSNRTVHRWAVSLTPSDEG
jgi:hypothetical protein